jgi:hypothetical protein
LTLFTSASIEIVNNQAALPDDKLMELQLAFEEALELAAAEVLVRFKVAQDTTPTVSLSDFYQS